MFKGKEIRKLMFISTALCVLLVLSVSFYLITSSRQHLKTVTERLRFNMAEQIADHLNTSFESLTDFLKDTPTIEFGINVLDLTANIKEITNFQAMSVRGTYDADFVTVEIGGTEFATVVKEGRERFEIPDDIFEGDRDYAVMERDDADGETKTYFAIKKPMPYDRRVVISYAVENTAQLDTITELYNEQKSDMVISQILVVALIFIIFTLLSLFIIQSAIKRFISDPIERINAVARDIVAGGTPEAIEVDEKSIFCHLEMLLKSGNVIFKKTDI